MAPRLPRPRLNLLELTLAAAVVGGAVVGLPLGLARIANGGLVEAALSLRTVADPAQPDLPPCPPLVMLLLRIAAWLPVGDLATRVNLGACAAAGVVAVLLSRLISRVLRDLNDRAAARGCPDEAGGEDETLGEGARRATHVDGETTGLSSVAAEAGGKSGPQIFGEKGIAVDPSAVGPAPRRRTSEDAGVVPGDDGGQVALDGEPWADVHVDVGAEQPGEATRMFREPTVRVAAAPPREWSHPHHPNVHEAPTRPVAVREPTARVAPVTLPQTTTTGRRAGREPTLRPVPQGRDRRAGRPGREATGAVVPVSLREPTGRSAPVSRRDLSDQHSVANARPATARTRATPDSTIGRSGRRAARAANDTALVGPLRGQVRLPTYQAMALLGGVIAPLASVAVFVALTTEPTTAISLALVLGVWLRLFAFERSPGTPRRALQLALLAGLALAAEPLTPLFVWPPVLLCGVRWFRRGERWPVAAPLAFFAGVIAALPTVVWLAGDEAGAGPRRFATVAFTAFGDLVSQRPALSAVVEVAGEALGQLGVVAILVAFVGAVVLLTRRPRLFAFCLTTAVAALALVAMQGHLIDGAGGGVGKAYGVGVIYGAAGLPWAVLVAALAVPLAVGIAHLSGKLGAARGAAALALSVMVAVWPAFDGGMWRFHRPSRVNESLLARIENKLGPAVAAVPGSPAADALLRYGQAVGRRPDLVLPAVVRLGD